MKIFAMADLHLSLASGKPMDVFGERWAGHTEKMKDNWDRLVGADDTVIVSGDVSWGLKLGEALPDLQWIHERPGKKLITKGNHDLWWSSISKLNGLFDDITFIQNGCAAAGDVTVCGTRGWILRHDGADWTEHDEKIFRREQLRLAMSLDAAVSSGKNRIIVSMHYPPTDRFGNDTEFTRIIDRYGVSDVIYGHLHGAEAEKHAFNGVKNGVKYSLVSSDTLCFVPTLIYSDEL